MMHAVALLTTSPETRRLVESALKNGSPASPLTCCGDLRELAASLRREAMPVAIVDIDPQPRETLRHVALVIDNFPQTKFILVSNEFHSELLVESMQAGARLLLAKSAIASDAAKMVDRLVGASSAARGLAVAVLSCGGGCGATTIAVNLANEFGVESGKAALLVDLDGAYGGAGSYLGLSSSYRASDVLGGDRQIDGQLIRSTAVAYSDHLDVMLSPSHGFFQPVEYSPQRLPRAVEACRGVYSRCVIDAPRIPAAACEALAEACSAVMIVFQMTVKDLRCAKALLSVLRQHNVPETRVHLLGSRIRRHKWAVPVEDAVAALEGRQITPIASDYIAAVASLNLGKPLADAAPRSPLRKDIAELARQLVAGTKSATAEVQL
jgi:pilus assembly protein CpaE